MNMISKAVQKGLHLCGDKTLEQQTWEQFKNISSGKKIFVFGAGRVMNYFLRHCCNHMEIAGVVDNDKEKQQHRLGWHSAEAYQTMYENIIIQSPDVLKLYSPQEVAVLITSVNNYQAIVSQLQSMRIINCFVLLMMEANSQRYLAVEEQPFSQIRDNYIQWCCRQAIQARKIVISYGEYGGHAKYIIKQLLKQRNDLDIVWLTYDPQMEAPDGVRLAPMQNWKSYTYELETAGIWLFDITVQEHIVKRPGQIYIQAKHWSSITLKKFYLDDKSSCTSPEMASWIKRNGEMMDYLLSGSDFDEATFRSGFAFRGRAIRVGSSRSDLLFDKTIREEVLHKFGLDSDAHTLLYAPTYREAEYRAYKSMSVSLDLDRLLCVLHNKFGGEWYIFVRLHPLLDFDMCGIKESERVINVGNYPDSEELVAASDMMITDYSSIMFEEAFVKRPVFLYAPDRKEYIDGERGLWIDYDTLPFPIAETNEELEQCIMRFKKQEYEQAVTQFLDNYGVHEDGHASERAAEFISALIDGKGYDVQNS